MTMLAVHDAGTQMNPTDEREFSGPLDFRRAEGGHRAHLVVASRRPARLEQEASGWLHPREQAQLAELRAERRRTAWLLGRYCAKRALGAWQGGGLAGELQIAAGIFGQPLVRGVTVAGARVSVAHATAWGAAVAFGDAHPLGIDLEAVQPERIEVLRSQATEAERAAAGGWLEDEAARLTWIWTAKEALSKVLGTGLMTPFSLYELTAPRRENGWLVAEFTQFAQYRAQTVFFAGMALSLVLPKRSELAQSAATITTALGAP